MATSTTVARSQEKRRELADKLEQGYTALLNSETYQQYLQTAARFHTYSAGNVLLIMMQRPEATRVAGFRAWQHMGRPVKRGETAIRILAPGTCKAEGDADAEQTRCCAGFRVAAVVGGGAGGVGSDWVGWAATAGSCRGGRARRPLAVVLGTTVRFLVVLGFAVAGALSGLMQTGPLFIWISISYLIVLLIDTVWLVQQSKSDLDQTST